MKEQYAGMTVNERLYVSGCMKDFDKAVKNKDVNDIIYILKTIELDSYGREMFNNLTEGSAYRNTYLSKRGFDVPKAYRQWLFNPTFGWPKNLIPIP